MIEQTASLSATQDEFFDASSLSSDIVIDVDGTHAYSESLVEREQLVIVNLK